MKKKLIIIIPIVIALLVFVGLYTFLNYTDDKTNLTVLEKVCEPKGVYFLHPHHPIRLEILKKPYHFDH